MRAGHVAYDVLQAVGGIAMDWKKIAAGVVIAATLAAVPFSAAEARWWRRGPVFWPFAAGAAVVGGAAAVATAPLRAVAPPYYYPPGYYYAPAPTYYYAPSYYGPSAYGTGY